VLADLRVALAALVAWVALLVTVGHRIADSAKSVLEGVPRTRSASLVTIVALFVAQHLKSTYIP
jgi:hypothetical protein